MKSVGRWPSMLRVLAERRRQKRLLNPDPEEWARQVEEERKRGYHLIRVSPELIVAIRDYSLLEEGEC